MKHATMRRLVLALFLIGMAVCARFAECAEVRQNVNLREGASTEYDIIRLLDRGEQITVIEEEPQTGYVLVETDDGQQGYAWKRNLRLDESTAHMVDNADLPVIGEEFAGNDRKAAKTSFADAEEEEFDDLKALIESLPKDKVMKDLHIPKASGSGRVENEMRNVKVSAWLYAV